MQQHAQRVGLPLVLSLLLPAAATPVEQGKHLFMAAPRFLTDSEVRGLDLVQPVVAAVLGVRHGVVHTPVHGQAAVGRRHPVVVVRQHSLDRHAAPEPTDVGGVPAVPRRATGIRRC